MPAQPFRPRALQWRVFRGTEAVRSGQLTVDQLRSSAWVRVRRDAYADARIDRDHGLACLATGLLLPAAAALAGLSAAYLYGVEHAADFEDDVHVITEPTNRVRPKQGIRVHYTPVDKSEIVTVGGLARTTPLRPAATRTPAPGATARRSRLPSRPVLAPVSGRGRVRRRVVRGS